MRGVSTLTFCHFVAAIGVLESNQSAIANLTMAKRLAVDPRMVVGQSVNTYAKFVWAEAEC